MMISNLQQETYRNIAISNLHLQPIHLRKIISYNILTKANLCIYVFYFPKVQVSYLLKFLLCSTRKKYSPRNETL